MTPTQQLITIDLYTHHARWTRYYTVPLPEPGFPHSFGHCALLIHRNSYYPALRKILERGFFEQTWRDSDATEVRYFKPTNRWRTYEPTEREMKAMSRLRARMTRADERDQEKIRRPLGQKSAQFLCSPQHNYWANVASHQHIFWADEEQSGTNFVQPFLIGEKRRSRDHAREFPTTERKNRHSTEPESIAEILGLDPAADEADGTAAPSPPHDHEPDELADEPATIDEEAPE